jgi:hypothetical protein
MSGELIECTDCGRRFLWSYDQQRDYKAREFDQPKRCPDCASQRRRERDAGMRWSSGPRAELFASAEQRWREAARIVFEPGVQEPYGEEAVPSDRQGCVTFLKQVIHRFLSRRQAG